MARFYPFLSYRHEQIDPGLIALRSEDEDRLKLLRALFRISTKSAGLESFLDCSSKSSFPQMLAPKQPPAEYDDWVIAELENFKGSILDSNSNIKPYCARLCSTMKIFSSEDVDSVQDSAIEQCVPISGEDRLVHPETLEAGIPYIKMMWNLSVFKLLKGAKRFPIMEIHRTSDTSVAFKLLSSEGTSYHSMHACDIPTSIVERAFSLTPSLPKIGRQPSTVPLRLPKSESHVPDEIAVQLIGFLQHRLRAHVLVLLSGPPGSRRLLRVEDTRVRFLKMNEAGNFRPTMRVTTLLHKTSVNCFCGAHNLSPPEERFKLDFTGKKTASVCFEMCGETLSSNGTCPTHGGNCSINQFVPGVCCCNLKISMKCTHEYRKIQGGYDKPIGTWFPIELNENFERLEISAFLASAAEWHRRASRVFSGEAEKRTERLVELVKVTSQLLDERVEKIDRFILTNPKRMSDADLQVCDLICFEMLNEGGWCQTKPPKKGNRTRKLVHEPTGGDLTTEQKKVLFRHQWLFPRYGQPYGVQKEDDSSLNAAPVTAAKCDAVRADSPPAKRHCVESKDHQYQELTEFLDCEGMQTMRSQIHSLLKNADLPQKQRERGEMFLQFLNTLEKESGEEIEGPLGYRVKPLVCKYKARNNGGRLYATGGATIQEFGGGYAYTCCIQGVPREIRPFLCCRWAHDFDMKNAQPEMLRQMSKLLEWREKRSPPNLPMMEEWCTNRQDFIHHVADLHRLPTDSEKWEDYRKDMVKRAVISLMFGGQYETWRKEVCKDLGRELKNEPVCEKLVSMEKELVELRKATFTSIQHKKFYDEDSQRLKKEGKKVDTEGRPDMAAIERSVFARIAQREENRVLDIMREFMKNEGFEVLSLCFDGLMVKHRRDKSPNLKKLNEMIYERTKVQREDSETGELYYVGYRLQVEEKPMFSDNFPKTSLSRV